MAEALRTGALIALWAINDMWDESCQVYTTAILVIIILWVVYKIFETPVSHPGGPRAKRTTRKAKFVPRKTAISSGTYSAMRSAANMI